MNSGIYEIRNAVNGKRYIGSAVTFAKRYRQHFGRLRKGNHCNARLQAAWNKHGESSFSFIPILICSSPDLLFYEQRCIDGLKPEYNLSPTAGSQLGYRFTEEAKAKMATRPPRVWTDEQKARVSAAGRARVIKPETRAKLSAAMRGNKFSLGSKRTDEQRAALALSMRGRKYRAEQKAITVAAEQRAKASRKFLISRPSTESKALIPVAPNVRTRHAISRLQLGNSHRGKTISAEARAKMRAAKLGKKLSAETRAKLSVSVMARGPEYHARLSASKIGNKNSLGRKQPPEVIAKISAASKAMWARRRAANVPA